jgi:hypothetical protein
MPTEVRSPINRKSGAQSPSPGAKSNPSSGGGEPEPSGEREDARRSKKPAPASAKLFGPEE